MNSARRRRSILSSATRFSPKAKSSTVQPHEQWLARAEDDLSFAQLGLREKYFFQVCFLSQQVVEKAFKAFLLAKGRSYPRKHGCLPLDKRPLSSSRIPYASAHSKFVQRP